MVIGNVPNDLVLLVKVTLAGSEEVPLGIWIGHFLKAIGEVGNFDESGYLPGLHVGHLVVESRL